jgi:predicted glycoside hydrolase/deacetylase ChbG (UPF0249 family)
MHATRYLIVNADDFGQSHGINRGIIEAYEHGIVTSASLMTRWPATAAAAEYAGAQPQLSVGLHFDLGEWLYRAGEWVALYNVAPLDNEQAITEEISAQLASFRRLLGKDPTHIDSHQHIHLREPVRSVLMEVAHSLQVPLRHLSTTVHYCGEFYGQTAEGFSLPDSIAIQSLLDILGALPEGLTELTCHPGAESDLETMYGSERVEELRVLCDPQVRATIAALGIELRSFTTWQAKW